MEFTKLRGFWKTKTTIKHNDVIEKSEEEAEELGNLANKSKVHAKTTLNLANENNFKIGHSANQSDFNFKEISSE